MDSILLSVRPKHCENIFTRKNKKLLEIRKNFPKKELPIKCFIYETKGKVIGEFICDMIYEFESEFWDNETYESICRVLYDMDTREREKYCVAVNGEKNELCDLACLTWDELRKYIGQGIKTFYAWHISKAKKYDTPKELSEFYTRCNIPENKCKLCDNCFDREDSYGRHYAVKKLTRPPQSWCYVEEL